MAELLAASGSRRITALTSVSGISGSTAMPIVMGGNTVQISHTNFLTTNGLIPVLNQQNVFAEIQSIVSGGFVTELDAGIINIFATTGNEDTFEVVVQDGNGIRFFDWDGASMQSFLKVDTLSGPITLFRNTTIDGDLRVDGSLIATQYVVSSSVSHITSSFSSGSTIFGDTLDDRHQFTGSVLVNGNVNAQSFTGSLSFTNLTNRPTLVSSSQQVISLLPAGTVSGSLQVRALLPSGTVSGSSQVSFNGITDKPTLVSSSQQIRDYGIFATTGSNAFIGEQKITGSLSILSGSGDLTSSLSFNHITFAPDQGGSVLEVRHNNNVYSEEIALKLFVNDLGGTLQYERNGSTVNVLQVAGNNNDLFISRNTRLLGTNLTIDGTLEAKQNARVTGSLVVSGSGIVIGNQTVSGSVLVSGSISQVGIGEGNTIIGDGAGTSNTPGGGSGDYNTFIGVDAAASNVFGRGNTAVGPNALNNNQNGDNNIAIGTEAGRFSEGFAPNPIVNDSIFIGNGTEAKLNNQTNQIVIGNFTTGNGSNTVTIGNNSITATYLKGAVSASSFTGSLNFTNLTNRPTLVSSSQQILDYDIFATTGSNAFIGNQIITGSTNISGSLQVNNDITIENGYIVLTQVSQSLEFVDDTAAALGGVPLGGLYRNGNFIAIRID